MSLSSHYHPHIFVARWEDEVRRKSKEDREEERREEKKEEERRRRRDEEKEERKEEERRGERARVNNKRKNIKMVTILEHNNFFHCFTGSDSR